MWLECMNCGNLWKNGKVRGKRAYEIENPTCISGECPSCSSSNIRWVVNPQYKKQSIAIYQVLRIAKLKELPHFNNVGDPRGNVTYDPRIISVIREDTEERYIWLPYWISVNNGKIRYGQFAQITSEDDFSELLINGIKEGVFSEEFIMSLRKHLCVEGE